MSTLIRLGQPRCLLLIPVLVWQGKRTRARVPRLPEAAGPRAGVSGAGGRSLRLAVLGESTAAGVGAARHEEALAGFLAAEVARLAGRRVHWRVVARNGATARAVRREMVPGLADVDVPDAIVVAVGVNDLLRLRGLRAWQREIEALLTAVSSEWGKVPVVLAGMPPVHRFPILPQPLRGVLGLRALAMDHVMRRVASVSVDVRHVPVEPPFEGGFSAGDGFDPSIAGYRAWGHLLAPHVAAGTSDQGQSTTAESSRVEPVRMPPDSSAGTSA